MQGTAAGVSGSLVWPLSHTRHSLIVTNAGALVHSVHALMHAASVKELETILYQCLDMYAAGSQ